MAGHHLEVQMRHDRVAGVSQSSQLLAGADELPLAHHDAAGDHVSIHRKLAVTHVDDDVISRRLLERYPDMMLHFVEAPQFTSRVRDYFDDGGYAALQWALVLRPVAGALIPGSGGLRKLR
jgi:hypothetical protein